MPVRIIIKLVIPKVHIVKKIIGIKTASHHFFCSYSPKVYPEIAKDKHLVE